MIPTKSNLFSIKTLPTVMVGLALTASLVLSIPQVSSMCSESCAPTHEWTIFGMNFGWLGVGFFSACLVALFLRRLGIFDFGLKTMLAGACGAEIAFLYVQKFIIGQWCPVCVAIATLVYLSIAVLFFQSVYEFMKQENRRAEMLKLTGKGAWFLSAVFVGCLVAAAGLGKPVTAEAGANGTDIVLGNKSSEIEVYVFTDWFCPACKRVEAELEKAYPELARQCKVVFADYPIHRESYNFIPYSISFAVNEKTKYMETRKALVSLAAKNRAPSAEDVQKAVDCLEVTYKPLPFADVNMCMQYCGELANAMQVEATPTVVVVNSNTKSMKKLVDRRN